MNRLSVFYSRAESEDAIADFPIPSLASVDSGTTGNQTLNS